MIKGGFFAFFQFILSFFLSFIVQNFELQETCYIFELSNELTIKY